MFLETFTGVYVSVYMYVYLYRVAVTPPGMAREDWKIVRALSEVRARTTESSPKPPDMTVVQ